MPRRCVLTALLLLACQSGAPIGATCDRNSACASPLVCRFGRCRTECVEQRDCPRGTTCLLDQSGLGSCGLVDDPDCTSRGCEAPLACVGTACVNVCTLGVACPPGSACVPIGDGRARCVRADENDAGASDASTDAGSDAGLPVPDVGPHDAAQPTCTPGWVDGGLCDTPIQIALGDAFSCVRPRSGLLWCWGALDRIARDGDTTDCTMIAGGWACPTPAPLRAEDASGHVGETTDLNFVDAQGTGGCFAPQTGGTVSCWGATGAPLGRDGSTGAHARLVRQAGTTLGNLDRFIVFSGSAAAQELFPRDWHGWGSNVGDVLGGGTASTEARDSTMFADMNGTVATAATHACAIAMDGGVACWGSNEHGESDPLHVGPTVGLSAVAGVTDALELVVGTTHSCALVDAHPGRHLVCWGARDRLYFDGDVGACTASSVSCGPTTIPLTLDLAHVWPSRNTDDFCVTDAAGAVWCWGEGGAVTSPRPAIVRDLPAAASVVVTGTHGCAISTNSQLWCWGRDESGELGRGTIAPAGYQRATPVTFR